MSTDLIDDDFKVTRFYSGELQQIAYQITVGPNYIVLSREQVVKFCKAMIQEIWSRFVGAF